MKLTANQIKEKVSDGKIFKIVFQKRGDGEFRTMICRLGVKQASGAGAVYDAEDYGLLTVFDMHKRAYRNISLDNVVEIAFRHESHFFHS